MPRFNAYLHIVDDLGIADETNLVGPAHSNGNKWQQKTCWYPALELERNHRHIDSIIDFALVQFGGMPSHCSLMGGASLESCLRVA
ncbi:MAG: hypothetical protein ETSY1_07230 [Candidatus Entotheonella factor]|uniref:Uncharacterized protein n=1 Tax=Entotheonella factor TaxID=1429438 RepID=W4LUT5_ENTF1|nr:MAG: hypothetical protein ETSY1_07230 [Candidatus Entotheonella factor]